MNRTAPERARFMSGTSRTLILYSTPACHLCERAIELLRSMPELSQLTVDEVDISCDAPLLERYGRRIPVLARATSGRELDWPFNADDVIEWLAEG